MPKKPPQLAKLSRPRLYKAVARERLFRLLDEKREHPVVWIVGPPGAGKTTLAASYLEEAGLPAIWYQMDSGDSDPATFFYYLKQAIDAVTPVAHNPLPLLTPEYLADLPAFARLFFREAFLHLPDDTVFVFDNYHEIADSSTLHAALAASLKETSPGANILIVSRANQPPPYAEPVVSKCLVKVDWSDLRLSEQEVVALATSRGITDLAIASALHLQSSGWMAGVTLMLDRLRDGEKLDNLDRSDAWDSVFDYFAGLIFDGADEEMRRVLMKTALLPWVDRPLAEAVTGSKSAIAFHEELHRRHLFTDRRSGNEVTFQHHALFRAFLINKANEFIPEHERHAIAIQAGRELRARGRAEEAFALFVEARDWIAVEDLILETAPGLMAQGRWQTLEQWIMQATSDQLRANPWVSYWLGRARTIVNPVAARSGLESAYKLFLEREDEVGQMLCATTILEGLYYEFENIRPMDPWIDRVATLIRKGVLPKTKEDELRVHSAVMMAVTFRLPRHAMIEYCLKRVVQLLQEPFDPNIKIVTASMLLGYANVAMDNETERIAYSVAHPLLHASTVSAPRVSFYWNAEGYTHYLYGRYDQALECFASAGAIKAQDGFGDWPSPLVDFRRGLCERRAGLLECAEATLRQIESKPFAARSHGIAGIELLRAGVAFDRGDFLRAIEASVRSYRAFDEGGHFNGTVLVGMVASNMAIAANRFDVAEEILLRLRGEAYEAVTENYLGAIVFNQAWLAHRRGEVATRRGYLAEALRRARDDRSRVRFRWYANAMAELLPVALSEKLEEEVALSLAQEFSVIPEPADIEGWPWPVKIYTLGHFELVVGGALPEYSRKVPKKVLALLQAIVAFGCKEIPEQRILDALWPDDDGDAARRALTSTLHRLRKLMGSADAIVQAGSKLTLNQKCCWVDAMAFERRLEADRSEPGFEAAIALYRGAFLVQEDAPWAVPVRERLRSKFIQAVGKQGASLEKAGSHEQAIELYMRGIEADGLVESFYQGLMRCYEKLDRRTEAASVYRRLRQTLSVTLGVLPSSESQRLFAILRSP